jgi:N-acetylgalactosamine-N,N'-diacetylbacillosaminyl-diphospho-undecaprenol 4-alpha-N-acetylgalactosaminyltransferase
MTSGVRGTALFIINSLTGGGAERVMSTLLRASSPLRDRFDISLALLDREAAAYTPPEWVETIQLDCQGRLLSSIRAVRKLVSDLRPDVTLSFLTRSNTANVLATAGRPTTCLISERVNASAHLRGGLSGMAARMMVRATYPRADHVIAVSQGVAQDLRQNFGVKQSRVSVIANPVDHDRIATLSTAAPALSLKGGFVVAAGRLVPNKNFAMLIDAFARADLPASLVILGEGPLRDALQAQIERLGLEGRVLLPGFLDNPFAVLKRAALFALPSNAEGFPNGMVEAMACGLPVVAANCASGPSEILLGRAREDVHGIVHGPAGCVVPQNNPAAFAEALRAVFEPAGRAARAAAALDLSRQFSVERTATRYWAAIDGAMSRRGAAPKSSATGDNHPIGEHGI